MMNGKSGYRNNTLKNSKKQIKFNKEDVRILYLRFNLIIEEITGIKQPIMNEVIRVEDLSEKEQQELIRMVKRCKNIRRTKHYKVKKVGENV